MVGGGGTRKGKQEVMFRDKRKQRPEERRAAEGVEGEERMKRFQVSKVCL